MYIYFFFEYIYIYSDPEVDRIFFWRVRDLCWNYVGCRPLKKKQVVGIFRPPRGGRKLVVGIWFGGSQAAVGPARGVHNSLKIFYLPGLKQYSIYFLVLFDFCIFQNFSRHVSKTG